MKDEQIIEKNKHSPKLLFPAVFIVFISAAFIYLFLYNLKAETFIPSEYVFNIKVENSYKTLSPYIKASIKDKYNYSRYEKLLEKAFNKESIFCIYEETEDEKENGEGEQINSNYLYILNIKYFYPLVNFYLQTQKRSSSFLNYSAKDLFLYNLNFKGEAVLVYFRLKKNLLMASTNESLLLKALSTNNRTKKEMQTLTAKKYSSKNTFEINTDFLFSNLSLINNIKLTQTFLKLKNDLDLPEKLMGEFTIEKEYIHIETAFDSQNLNKRKMIQSRLQEILPQNISFIMELNSFSLEEILTKVLLNEKEYKIIEKLLEKNLKLSINDLLYSWTENPVAVLQFTNSKNKIYAVKIKDEELRKTVFKKVYNNKALKEIQYISVNSNTIYNLKTITLVKEVLKSKKINLSSVYYLLKDGYFYISESKDDLFKLCLNSSTSLNQAPQFAELTTDFPKENHFNIYEKLTDSSLPVESYSISVFSVASLTNLKCSLRITFK